MIFDKIIHNSDNIKWEPNTTYLLAKPGNRYMIVITDSKSIPAYPWSESSETTVGLTQNIKGVSPNEKEVSTDNISLYKPHLDLKELENGVLITLSDNLMTAIANSYKRISTPNPMKTYALGLDGKAVEIPKDITKELDIDDTTLKRFKTKLKVPDGIKTIEDNAFFSEGIDELELPNSLKQIGHGTFKINNLTEVKLPAFCEYYNDSFDEGVLIVGGKKI